MNADVVAPQRPTVRPRPKPRGPGQPFWPYVSAWALLAVALTTLTLSRPWPTDVDVALVAILWVGVVVAAVVHVPVQVRDTREASNFVEVVAVPAMILLDPSLAVVVGGSAALVAETVLTRGQPTKLVFNTSWHLVGLAVGSWTFQLLAGEFGPTPGVLALGTAAFVGALYVFLNTVAFTGIVALKSRRSWASVLAEELAGSALIGVGMATLGVLVAVLLVTVPLALPLLALPLALQRTRVLARSEGYDRLELERERLRRTVHGSSDGVVLLDGRGRVEVWNPAMEQVTGLSAAEAVGATLPGLALGDLVGAEPEEGGHRVEVGNRTVEVRGSVPDSGTGRGWVLSVRDVTSEAELAQIREDLVNRISHELRTPLTTMSGFLELVQVRWDQLDDARRRELIRTADRGAQRLSTLVADLMTWARVEARERESTRTEGTSTCELAEVVGGLPPDVAVAPDARWLLEPEHRVALSASELHRVLDPLLANARAHGAPPVTITAERVEGSYRVAVRDAGAGLPPNRVDELFAPFTQGTLGLQRTEQGLGLGLAIARGTAELAGGTLGYVSAEEGHAFVATLPTA